MIIFAAKSEMIISIMGFWKTFFGGEPDEETEKREAETRNFELLKYDGVKAMRMGQTDYAVKCFEKALETKDDAEVRDYLSRAYLQLGRYDEALRQLKTVMALEPDNLNLKLQAASVAYIKEDYDEMAALCDQALALDNESAAANLFYARAELGRKNMVQAIARLSRSIALDSELVEARLVRAQTLLGMGDVKGTREDVDWLKEHTQDNEDVLLADARLLAAEGNVTQAMEAYGLVVDANPFCTDAFRERGKLRLDSGDKAGAEEDMKMVIELNPQEMADVSGDYSAEGIEQKTRQAYSNLNPFGI